MTTEKDAFFFGDMKKYAEERIDVMRKQKDEELEHYKKEIDRQKRFEMQKGAAGAENGHNQFGKNEAAQPRKRIVKKPAGAFA